MEAPHYTLYVRLGGAVAGMVGCGEENLSRAISLKLDTGKHRHSFMHLNMGLTVAIDRKLTTTQNMGISTES
jgi:hypothetical protein